MSLHQMVRVMRQFLSACLLLLVTVLMPAQSVASSNDITPASTALKQQFDNALAHDLLQDRVLALQTLYYTVGLDIYTKEMFRRQIETIAKLDEPVIRFRPLAGDEFAFEKAGRRFYPNLEPLGTIVIEAGEIQMTLPYSQANGHWVIPATVTDRIGKPVEGQTP